MRIAAFSLILSLIAFAAGAELVVDQQQPEFLTASGGFYIGGESQQKLAQTVTAGRSGLLRRIDIPIRSCMSGTLILEIVELQRDAVPGSRVLATRSFPFSDFPAVSPVGFRGLELDPPLAILEGQRFAIVLRNPSGRCTTASSPSGDRYSGGRLYYDARPNPPGWAGTSDDLPFKTVVEEERTPEGACKISGPLIISETTPVCSCLTDRVLRAQRCALFHPSFVLYRRIPWPLPPGAAFKVEWTFLPLTVMSGPLELIEHLPAGFVAGAPHLKFAATRQHVGKSLSGSYQARAPSQSGRFDLKTEFRLQQEVGSMTTAIHVGN